MTDRPRCTSIYETVESWTADMDFNGPPLIRHNVQCSGHLYRCPICGETAYCNVEGHCLKDDVPEHWVQRRFSLDNGDEEDEGGFVGWTRGENWNGWSCPRFEFDAAMALAALSQGHVGERLSYNADEDKFVLTQDGEANDIWTAEAITTPLGEKKVYGIGVGAWCWNEFPTSHTPDSIAHVFDTPSS